MVIVSPRFLKLVKWIFNFQGEVGGFALLPFIIVASEEFNNHKVLINHEKIHLRQQLELLFVIFTVWYIIEFRKKGYMSICFEREAYANQFNLDYLKTRPLFAFYKYRK